MGMNLEFSLVGMCREEVPNGVLLLPCRTSHSRAKAEAAVTAAQKAQEEARIARITAKEFSPSFQHRENGQSCAQPCPSHPKNPPKIPWVEVQPVPTAHHPHRSSGSGKDPGNIKFWEI